MRSFVIKINKYLLCVCSRQPNKKFSFAGGLVTGLQTFNVDEPSKCKQAKDLMCVLIKVPKDEDAHFHSYSLKITDTDFDTEGLDWIFTKVNTCIFKLTNFKTVGLF